MPVVAGLVGYCGRGKKNTAAFTGCRWRLPGLVPMAKDNDGLTGSVVNLGVNSAKFVDKHHSRGKIHFVIKRAQHQDSDGFLAGHGVTFLIFIFFLVLPPLINLSARLAKTLPAGC